MHGKFRSIWNETFRACIHSRRTLSGRAFCRPAALKKLEIRQDSRVFCLARQQNSSPSHHPPVMNTGSKKQPCLGKHGSECQKTVKTPSTGRKRVTRGTQEGFLSFSIRSFQNFFKVLKTCSGWRKYFFDRLSRRGISSPAFACRQAGRAAVSRFRRKSSVRHHRPARPTRA